MIAIFYPNPVPLHCGPGTTILPLKMSPHHIVPASIVIWGIFFLRGGLGVIVRGKLSPAACTESLRLEVCAPNMGPWDFLGTIKGTYRVYSRYIRIPGLRAQTRGP